MRRVFQLFQNRKRAVCFTLLCCMGSVLSSLFWNKELAVLIDRVQEGNGLYREGVVRCSIYLIWAALFHGGMQFLSAYTGEYAVHDLRMSLAKVTMKREYGEVARENGSEPVSVLQNEMEDINRYVSENLFTLCTTVISFILTLLFLLTQNVRLTIFYLLPVAGLALYTTVSGKVIYRYTKIEQEQQKKMNGITGVLLNVFPIVRIFEAERLLEKRYQSRIAGWNDAVVAQERVKARLMSVSGMLSCIPLVLLMSAGGSMILKGSLSIGTLYAFVNLSGNVSGVMINISVHLANFRRFCGNLERVRECLQEKGDWDHGDFTERG
ncbi:MAG: ABC transporter ATP-binding protein [Lachnospiraceae bacterium]|nr:ABC transporter ATP-binding protein [Lachnospiraceae bacterium]